MSNNEIKSCKKSIGAGVHRDRETTPKDRKVRETEAEAVVFVVCHGIGMDTNSLSSDYIQLYNGDKETLMESLGRIQKTASEILEAVIADNKSKCETEDGEPCATDTA